MAREKARYAQSIYSRNQLSKEIIGVFLLFLEMLDNGFVADSWTFYPSFLRDTFHTLATGVEKSLAHFWEVAWNNVEEPLESLMANPTITEPSTFCPDSDDWC